MNYIFADLESVVAYLKKFAVENVHGPSFYFGTIDQVIAASTGDEEFHYPCVWLDLPKMLTEDNESANLMENYRFNVAAFYNAPSDDSSAKAKAYSDSLKILYDLQKKIKHDTGKGIIAASVSGNQKIPLNPALFNATHYGYYLDFEVGFFANTFLC